MNYFLDAVKNKYATFTGRARRAEFWQFLLFLMISAIVVGLIGSLIRMPFLGMIVYLALIVPYIAVFVRRMHDVGKSGWYMLIPIYSLILALSDGQQGANEYGPDPKGRETSADFTTPNF